MTLLRRAPPPPGPPTGGPWPLGYVVVRTQRHGGRQDLTHTSLSDHDDAQREAGEARANKLILGYDYAVCAVIPMPP